MQKRFSRSRERNSKANAVRSNGESKGKDVKSKDKAKDAKSRKRLEDLADAEEKPMATTPHPFHTTAVVPLSQRETSCESSSEQTVRSPGAGSTASAETQQMRPIAAVPPNETYLMMDTCAGASIFLRGFDQSATDDSTVAPNAKTDDPVHGDAGKKSCFGLRDGRKFQVQYNEADVSFRILSIGEASQQGSWFVFGPGCQAMFPSLSGVFLRTCVNDPNAAKKVKHRGVHWLPCSATEHTDGAPLCPARSAVEAPMISVPDPDAAPGRE